MRAYDPNAYYDPDLYCWLRPERGGVRLGLTAFALRTLGAITALHDLPTLGTVMKAGTILAAIESDKTLHELPAPIPAKVLAVNEILAQQPARLPNDPYGSESWLLYVQPTTPDWKNQLLPATAYSETIDRIFRKG